jgi:hypothetical protein
MSAPDLVPKFPLALPAVKSIFLPAGTPRVRMFIEAEKKQLNHTT